MSARRRYAVEVVGIGRIHKTARCIAEARDWATTAFGKGQATVSVVTSGRLCDGCQSRPCCCRPKERRS